MHPTKVRMLSDLYKQPIMNNNKMVVNKQAKNVHMCRSDFSPRTQHRDNMKILKHKQLTAMMSPSTKMERMSSAPSVALRTAPPAVDKGSTASVRLCKSTIHRVFSTYSAII